MWHSRASALTCIIGVALVGVASCYSARGRGRAPGMGVTGCHVSIRIWRVLPDFSELMPPLSLLKVSSSE